MREYARSIKRPEVTVRMSKKTAATPQPKSLAKGLLAGLIGGLAGVLAMAAAERLIPRRAPAAARTVSPPRPIFARSHALELRRGRRGRLWRSSRVLPAATAKQGVAFGMAWRPSLTKARSPRLASSPDRLHVTAPDSPPTSYTASPPKPSATSSASASNAAGSERHLKKNEETS